MAQKILIVEDEEKIARFVELELLHVWMPIAAMNTGRHLSRRTEVR